jgi:hypothetical protein
MASHPDLLLAQALARSVSVDGRPVAGATLDVWQTATNRRYAAAEFDIVLRSAGS